MQDVHDILHEIIQFRDERNWKQFHDAKNLAAAISIEAAELNELFLWKNIEESNKVNKEDVKEELADILIYCFILSEKYQFNILDIMREKMGKNALRYPVEKSRDNAKKYNEL